MINISCFTFVINMILILQQELRKDLDRQSILIEKLLKGKNGEISNEMDDLSTVTKTLINGCMCRSNIRVYLRNI